MHIIIFLFVWCIYGLSSLYDYANGIISFRMNHKGSPTCYTNSSLVPLPSAFWMSQQPEAFCKCNVCCQNLYHYSIKDFGWLIFIQWKPGIVYKKSFSKKWHWTLWRTDVYVKEVSEHWKLNSSNFQMQMIWAIMGTTNNVLTIF